jgi:glycosyltransferase involved in cell wall biosynthesis
MAQPIRILQVIGAMDMGGIETWLVQVLRRLDRKRFQVDILTHTEEECFYDHEVRALGAHIIPCLHPSRPWRYARNFWAILKKYGPYDIVHSHVFRYSGVIMRLAALAGLPVRIGHSHNTSEDRRLTLFRRGYNELMRRWLNRHATHLLAVSRDAATALYGPHILADARLHLIPPGIELDAFQENFPAGLVKNTLGLAGESKVVGHIGRFEEQKNHYFFMEIARHLSSKDSSLRFLLLGDGPLRPQVEAKARDLGLAERVIFAGLRRDVPGVLKGVFDLLLFPSKWEGMGRVVVEAQAAGVPCLISDVIPAEVDLVKPLVRRMSLRQEPEAWAEAAWELLSQPPPVSREEAWRQVAASPFNIVNNVRDLENLYLSAYEQSRK